MESVEELDALKQCRVVMMLGAFVTTVVVAVSFQPAGPLADFGFGAKAINDRACVVKDDSWHGVVVSS